ncbi:MAG: TRAP transporter small permease [Planctomycetaceae bacterium]|nr:TRAP transporter small permease [Planctomycetaceae bacterium]
MGFLRNLSYRFTKREEDDKRSVFGLLWDHLEETVAAILFLALLVFCLLQVLFRFVINISLDWTEELASFSFIIMVYVAASLGVARNRHARAEIVDLLLSPRALRILNMFVALVWGIFNLLIAHAGWGMATDAIEIGLTSPVLEIPMGWLYMVIPVMFTVMAVRVFSRIVTLWKERPV